MAASSGSSGIVRDDTGSGGGGNALRTMGADSVIPTASRSGIVAEWLVCNDPGSAAQPGMTASDAQTNCDRPGIEPTMGPITSSPAFSRP